MTKNFLDEKPTLLSNQNSDDAQTIYLAVNKNSVEYQRVANNAYLVKQIKDFKEAGGTFNIRDRHLGHGYDNQNNKKIIQIKVDAKNSAKFYTIAHELGHAMDDVTKLTNTPTLAVDDIVVV